MKKLNEQLELFFKMIDQHGAIMLLIDATNGKILDCNIAAEEFFCMPGDEIIGIHLSELNIATREIIDSELELVYKNQSHYFESILRKNNGSKVDISMQSSLIDFQNRIYYFTIINDISERKTAEKSLKESEERWQFAIDGSNQGLWDWNISSNEVFFSKKWKEMLGFEDNEILGSLEEWKKRVHPEDLSNCLNDIQKHIDGITENYENEHRVLCKDGSYKWIHDKGKVIAKDKNGKPLRMIGTHTDIHEKKIAEQLIRESQEKYKLLFDESPIGIELYDKNGKLLDINKSCEHIFGVVDKSELVKFNLFDDPNVNEEVKQQLKVGNRVNYQSKFDFEVVKEMNLYQTTKHGKIWIDVSITPLRANEDNGYLVKIQDVTHIKMVESELEISKHNFETFFNNSDYFAFVLDMQGNILHVNQTVFNRLGYSAHDLIGKSVLEVHPSERRMEALAIVTDMIKGVEDSCPIPLITKENNQIPVETRISFGTWDNQPVIYGISKDISQLKLSEEKFSILFKLNPSPCGLSDLATGKYVEVNNAFYTFFGFEKDEVIGKTAYELGIMDRVNREKIISNADSKGNIYNFYTELNTKDKSIKNVFLSAETIFVQDRQMRFTVVTDITELKKAEYDLKKAINDLNHANKGLEESLSEKNKLIEELELAEIKLKDTISTKDKFFNIIAHDLKSPFNGLLGISEMIDTELESLSMNDLKKLAAILHSAATATFKLINELLDWSRIQTGVMKFSPKEGNLFELIDKEVTLMNPRAVNKNINLINKSHQEIIANYDKSMISTVLRNLISNAIKFTKSNGSVLVETEIDADEIIVSVKDTGIGISAENLQKLFKIDGDFTSCGTSGEAGTGLGLILCKEFVEFHKGKIWVDSAENEGSTFFFSIPVNH